MSAAAPEPVVAYIGVGSNLDDPPANIARALALLDANPDIERARLSPLYWTPPWGVTDQPEFLNGAIEARVRLDAPTLLQRCLGIERAMGRVRADRWGPRRIDLDLLLHGDTTLERPGLTLPHPRLTERAFVLRPLLDLAPNLALPNGAPLTAFAEKLADEFAKMRSHNSAI